MRTLFSSFTSMSFAFIPGSSALTITSLSFSKMSTKGFHLELSVRFFDNPELSWFWVDMAMEEKQHTSMLQHCREAGVFASERPA